MERGSVVDAQIEKQEQIEVELEKCKSPMYFYFTYWKPRSNSIPSLKFLEEMTKEQIFRRIRNI